MGIKDKFWKLNGNDDSLTYKGALVIMGTFAVVVLVVAAIVAIF